MIKTQQIGTDMVNVNYEGIPLNWAEQVKEVEQTKRFKAEIEFIENHTGDKEITVAFQAQHNGALLVNCAANDLWLYRNQEGSWQQAYIGYDDSHCQIVLTDDKYKCVFKAHIADFKEILPVYIKKIQ